ncbi:endothelin-converting enzyme [Fistulifera solaris]|uniref:Endothelin-converting enzyme n=1 Tax=Fistulifera solaris TaxID=1519565 RepID=A0A1Z5KS48_FISSO|nr:endothelin-converting enzyme [Fistulifera solaris]|eukprot:GAX28758.1 endothelin-converting enzyme [Fistulifera solaris]
MSFYSSLNYWNQRYATTANDQPCEWYMNYNQLRPFLEPDRMGVAPGTTLRVQKPQILKSNRFPRKRECRVLILGCGNSTLGEEMILDGWLGPIMNVDFSDVVIDQMKHKYGEAFYRNVFGYKPLHPMKFVCADITKPLPFANESFDLIICKGAFDAVLSGPKTSVHLVVAEIHRVLARSHGVFFLVTTGNPDSRVEYLEYKYELNHYWQGVSVHSLPVDGSRERGSSAYDKCVYAYLCRKHHWANAGDKLNT